MFTDRFIKVPISVYNIKEKELTGKEILEDSWFKFLPFELAGYRPTYDDNFSDKDYTTIILKSGDTTTANIPPEEFEKLLNEHQK